MYVGRQGNRQMTKDGRSVFFFFNDPKPHLVSCKNRMWMQQAMTTNELNKHKFLFQCIYIQYVYINAYILIYILFCWVGNSKKMHTQQQYLKTVFMKIIECYGVKEMSCFVCSCACIFMPSLLCDGFCFKFFVFCLFIG